MENFQRFFKISPQKRKKRGLLRLRAFQKWWDEWKRVRIVSEEGRTIPRANLIQVREKSREKFYPIGRGRREELNESGRIEVDPASRSKSLHVYTRCTEERREREVERVH